MGPRVVCGGIYVDMSFKRQKYIKEDKPKALPLGFSLWRVFLPLTRTWESGYRGQLLPATIF